MCRRGERAHRAPRGSLFIANAHGYSLAYSHSRASLCDALVEPRMPYYHTLGKIPKKRHIAFRKPDGGLYAEQLVGHEGFTGTSALLYHIYAPTTVKSVKRLKEIVYEADADHTLKHRHFRTARMK